MAAEENIVLLAQTKDGEQWAVGQHRPMLEWQMKIKMENF